MSNLYFDIISGIAKMDRYIFNEKFPALGSAFGAFHDSPAHNDERLARDIYQKDPPDVRAELIGAILVEAHRFMETMEQDWAILGEEANRRLYALDETRSWFVRIIIAWQEELNRLKGEGSNFKN